MTDKPPEEVTCPNCDGPEIDLVKRECLICGIGLPISVRVVWDVRSSTDSMWANRAYH